MPLWFPLSILLLTTLVALASAGWLLLHAQDVARAFRTSTELEPGPDPRRASRRASRSTVIAMLVVFNLAWIAATGIWVYSLTDDAQTVIDAEV
ncbi:hypothetical protein M3P36_03550 [Altererythrobacter sp. KTW20L]|uniref:hypothetical protein n=1 Tax=Altererythrobacter sp. KTW20L TaxID=2942210 RepID=UPI0020C145D1|nr:hypothetical protein [Altererythrobacter sp. KTW20L]MCL6250122.1 hypothetical protein [Altererythrobacter sp. KTW20L]